MTKKRNTRKEKFINCFGIEMIREVVEYESDNKQLSIPFEELQNPVPASKLSTKTKQGQDD